MRYVTLDIHQSGISLLETNGDWIVQWSTSPIPEGLVNNGVVVNPPSLAAHIRALLGERFSARGEIIVCLSGVRYIPRVFSVPNFKRSLRVEVIRHESERRMPVPLDQLHLSWRRLSGDQSGERYFVVGVPRRSVQSLIETMAEAGIKNYALDIKPIALARSAKARESVILNLDQDNAEVVLVIDGIPETMRSVPVDLDPELLSDTLGEIGAEVIRTIDYYNSTHLDRPMDPEAPIFITGAIARDELAINPLNQLFGSRITPVTSSMKCSEDFPVAGYAANLGLVLGRSKTRKLDVLASAPAMSIGIEPQEYRPPVRSGRGILLAGTVVLALALLFPVYQARSQAHSTTNALGQELAAMERDLSNAFGANASIEELSLQTGKLTGERRSVLGNQGRFSESLSRLLVGLPKGVVPGSVNMSGENLVVDGTTMDLLQVIDLAEQIESFDLFEGIYLESISSPGSDGSNGSNSNIFRIRADYLEIEAGDGRE
jgi:type IV pilus assembly protein PilM